MLPESGNHFRDSDMRENDSLKRGQATWKIAARFMLSARPQLLAPIVPDYRLVPQSRNTLRKSEHQREMSCSSSCFIIGAKRARRSSKGIDSAFATALPTASMS